MKQGTIFLIYTLLLISFINNEPLKADRKYFARSYTAYTLPQNVLELEFWQTGRFDKGLGYYYRWQPRFEVEYGVTDRLTAAMYFNFNEVKSGNNSYTPKPLGISTTSFEFRYRLTNQDELFVDPALYFEFGYGGDKVFYEPKILLSKRIGNFMGVLNFISEVERNPVKSETESKFELSAGIAYELNKNIGIAIEYRNHRNYKAIYEKELNQASFIGPTISFHTQRLYIVVNLLSQISGSPETQTGLDLSGHEKYELRTILGIEL